MARNINDIIREQLEIIIEKITEEQKTLGLTDSRRSAESMEVKGSRVLGATISATAYLQTNFQGVGMQPKAVGRDWINGLLSWGKLSPEAGETRLQTAFKVANIIKNKGSLIKRGKSGIDIDKIVFEGADNMAEALTEFEFERALQSISNIRFQK